MIIEIKDLPSGRKVSRILVDITFEDSSDHSEDGLYSNPIVTSSTIPAQESALGDVSEPVLSTISTDRTSSREPVEIPDEMLNMEF